MTTPRVHRNHTTSTFNRGRNFHRAAFWCSFHRQSSNLVVLNKNAHRAANFVIYDGCIMPTVTNGLRKIRAHIVHGLRILCAGFRSCIQCCALPSCCCLNEFPIGTHMSIYYFLFRQLGVLIDLGLCCRRNANQSGNNQRAFHTQELSVVNFEFLKLHIAPILPADLKQRVRNLAQRAGFHRFHQLVKQISISHRDLLELL